MSFKKLKKFLFNPIGFIQDSWINRSAFPKTFVKYQNLFVITHLGQLGQIEALIKQKGLKSCYLIILYTKKNLVVPKSILSSVNKKLFSRVNVLELPTFPNKVRIKNLFFIRNSYINLLKEINPKQLFLLSFEHHYAMLANLAKKRKIKVNLVEEGTATYKYKTYKEGMNTLRKGYDSRDKKRICAIKCLPFFQDIKPVLSIQKHFDKAYLCFPEMLENVFEMKETEQFFLYKNILPTTTILHLIKEYQISSNDILFLNQRYPIPYDIYAKCLLTILKDYASTSKVFIKLHPKDADELKEILINTIEEMGLSHKIIMIDNPKFLVEPLITFAKPKAVLALTSTSLVYTTFLSENTESFSIYPQIKHELLKEIEFSDKYYGEMENHFSILQQFDSVKIINTNE